MLLDQGLEVLAGRRQLLPQQNSLAPVLVAGGLVRPGRPTRSVPATGRPADSRGSRGPGPGVQSPRVRPRVPRDVPGTRAATAGFLEEDQLATAHVARHRDGEDAEVDLPDLPIIADAHARPDRGLALPATLLDAGEDR